MWVISWIMYGFHSLLTSIGLEQGSGPAWVLSIVGLTIVVRILIIPLFNKQTRATRLAQELNPEIQKLQKKYKGRTDPVSQKRQQEEMMAIYRDRGTSPFASCLPALIQMPIFFSLFRLLYAVEPLSRGTYQREAIGPIDQTVANEIANSTLFGAPVSSAFGTAATFDNPNQIRIVAAVMIILMILTLFFSQKQLMTKNLPESAQDPNNPAYKMQKYMLYGMPLIYVFTGFAFQIGVLIYWLTGNFWNIGQQTWLINNNPTPGSAAYKKRQEKLREKRIKKGLPPEEEKPAAEDDSEQPQIGQRQQPLGKARSKKATKKQQPAGSSESPDETSREVDGDMHDDVVRGPDGLTDAERAQKRYERRLAERQRANAKKKARQKKQQQNKKNRNF